MNLARQYSAPRLELDLCEGPAARVPSICHSLACHNMFGGGSSKSATSSDQRNVAATEGSLAVGAGGQYQEAGAVDAGGNITAGNTDLMAGGAITITSADAAVLNNALDRVSELSAGFGSSLNQFVSQASADQDNKVAALIGAVERAKTSSGLTFNVQNLVLWLIIGGLVLVGLITFRKKP